MFFPKEAYISNFSLDFPSHFLATQTSHLAPPLHHNLNPSTPPPSTLISREKAPANHLVLFTRLAPNQAQTLNFISSRIKAWVCVS
ncbi:unnamed protein product [Camellia sinensis]